MFIFYNVPFILSKNALFLYIVYFLILSYIDDYLLHGFCAPAYSKYIMPHSRREVITGISVLPSSESEYSVFGGTTG